MLRRCRLFWGVVTRNSLTRSTFELSSLLSTTNHSSTDTSDELKQFLHKNIVPLLEGSSFDRKHDLDEMKRKMCKLLEDAIFSAELLHARPEGRYVQRILSCILLDDERMHFLHVMTSAQASKIIEGLCSIGIRDESVYNVLIRKLDFHHLAEIARVMLAFSKLQLHNLTICSVVPLYCDEKWPLVFQVRRDDRSVSAKTGAESSNVFEAVRVLRALSTCTRGLILDERGSSGDASDAWLLSSARAVSKNPPHYDAINRLRNRLCLFILQNHSVMCGAHWINFVRALVNFPRQYQALDRLKEDPLFGSVMGKFVSDIARDQASKNEKEHGGGILHNGFVLGYELALIGFARIFDFAERRKSGPNERADTTPGSDVLNPGGAGRLVAQNLPFDCGLLDLVKLLPLLDQVPCTKLVKESRLRLVLQTLRNHTSTLQFDGIVKLLGVISAMDSRSKLEQLIQEIAKEAGVQLLASTKQTEIRRVRVASILSFASLLPLLRIRQCFGFVQYMAHAAMVLPPMLRPNDVLILLRAMAYIENEAPNLNPLVVRALLRKSKRYFDKHTKEKKGKESSSNALLMVYPTQCVGMMRAMAALNVPPTEEELYYLLGSSDDESLGVDNNTAPFPLPDIDVLSDLSRSLADFARQAVAAEKNGNLSTHLWRLGTVKTLLPLLIRWTQARAQEAEVTRSQALDRNPHRRVAWSGVMKTLLLFVDIKRGTCSFETMAKRLVEAYSLTKRLAESILQCTLREIFNACHVASEDLSEVPEKLIQGSFLSSVLVHMLSYLLMWEFMLCEASWYGAQRLLSATVTEEGKMASEKLLELKEDYYKFIDTPLSGNSNHVNTPMRIVQGVLGLSQSPSSDSSSVSGQTLLSKSHILEITNNLPFSISLVLNPGPINEFFSERSASLIVHEYMVKT